KGGTVFMTQNNRFNSKERVPKERTPKEHVPQGCIPKRHTSKRRTPKRRILKKRVSKSIALPVALALLHSFTAEASPEAHMLETRVYEQTNASTPVQDTRVQVLKMAGNKRIEASICADSMNR